MKILFAPAILLALAISGCTSPTVHNADTGTASPIPAPPSPPPYLPPIPDVEFAQPVALNTSTSAGEPMLIIAGDGSVWVVANSHNTPGGGHLWHSDPQGARFEYLGQPDPVVGGADQDIAVDSTGRLWITSLSIVTTCVNVGASTDGKAFLFDPTFCATSNGDRPWLVAGPNGRVYLVYAGGSGPYRLRIVPFTIRQGLPVRADGPDSMMTDTVGRQVHTEYRIGKPVVDAKGRLLVPTVGTDGALHLYRITDSGNPDGLSSEDFKVAPTHHSWNGSFPSLALDKAGHVYYVWSDHGPNDTTAAYVAVSMDEGRTWGAPHLVGQGLGTITFPSVAAGGDGRVGIAYYGTATPGADPNAVTGDWAVYYAHSANATAPAPVYTQRMASHGTVHHGQICDLGAACPPGTRLLDDFLGIATGPDGGARIVYASTVPGDQGIRYVCQTQGPGLAPPA